MKYGSMLETRKITSAIFTLIFVLSSFVLVSSPTLAAVSGMSITSSAITGNSVAVSTALTQTTINFELDSAITTSEVLTIVLNGTVASDDIVAADVSVSGDCSGTVDLVVDPIVDTTANPTLEITNISCAGSASGSVIIANGNLESTSTAGNYDITITSPYDTGAFLFYVGDENDVSVRALVDPTISFVIRNSADNGAQGNVGGGATGPNLCSLGNLSDAGVQTCAYRLKVSTNSSGGYTVNIATDGDLMDGSNSIANVAENSTVTGGNEGYGIALTAGSATNGSSVTESGNFNDDDTPIGNGTNTSLYAVDGPNNPSGTDTTNTALVTHRAEIDADTPAGQYSQLVTYTVTASF